MTRTEAHEIAKKNQAARMAAMIANLFRGAPAIDDATFGYRHGWYRVGEHSFFEYDLTGEKYDATQGGWAYA